MVVLSDGWQNRVSHKDLIHEIIGETSCDGDDADIPSGEPSAAGSGCAIDLADFLASQDQADLDGTQTIKTYTISFGAADGAALGLGPLDAGPGPGPDPRDRELPGGRRAPHAGRADRLHLLRAHAAQARALRLAQLGQTFRRSPQF